MFTDAAMDRVQRDADAVMTPLLSVVDEGEGAGAQRRVFQLPATTYRVTASEPATGTITLL